MAAEFDQYAQNYEEGASHWLGKAITKDQSDFIRVKAEWLVRNTPIDKNTRFLDYGCGTGILIKVLRDMGYDGNYFGCDVSAEMLKVAKSAFSSNCPEFKVVQEDRKSDYADQSFDVIVISGVIHHVPDEQRLFLFKELKRILKKDGKLFVFEHNPFNPVTQIVVKRTPIDKDAHLLSAARVRGFFSKAEIKTLKTEYLVFFPPKLKTLLAMEKYLSWLPMGGQYVVVGTKA